MNAEKERWRSGVFMVAKCKRCKQRKKKKRNIRGVTLAEEKLLGKMGWMGTDKIKLIG